MATFTANSLADGQVAVAKGAIYTVPGGTKAYIKRVRFFNTNAVTQLLEVWLKRSGGTSRKQIQFELLQNETADFAEQSETMELSPGDQIEAATTTASAVDYIVTGVEET